MIRLVFILEIALGLVMFWLLANILRYFVARQGRFKGFFGLSEKWLENDKKNRRK